MIQSLKKIPYFLFLLPVFFCLHGIIENYGFIEFGESFKLGLGILVCISIFYFMVLWFLKNKQKAALITFFIGLWYLFFGAIYDFIKSFAILSFMHKYSMVIVLILVATFFWILFVLKNKKANPKLFYYFNILLFIYCLLDVGIFLNKCFFQTKNANNITANNLHFDKSRVTEKPNVYYLLFDEYAGYKSLSDSLRFDNHKIYQFLGDNQFTILPTFANYNLTAFCMASILNMQYVPKGNTFPKVTHNEIQNRFDEIRNAQVFQYFKSMGYQLKNYSIFDIDDKHSLSDENNFLPVHSLLLTDKIFHNRLLWNTSFPAFLAKFSFSSANSLQYQHDIDNNKAINGILETAKTKLYSPTFSYAHFNIPHAPFYRDSLGLPLQNKDEVFNQQPMFREKELYISYLKYANSVIEKLVTTIVNNDSAALIIVMSDHGYRAPQQNPAHFNNFCAVRFPKFDKKEFDKNMSNVNFFRYIFNTEFHQNFPFLKDTSSYLIY